MHELPNDPSPPRSFQDVEKSADVDVDLLKSDVDVAVQSASEEEQSQTPGGQQKGLSAWYSKLSKAGVEVRGMQPVPEEERTDGQTWKQFFHWFGADVNILCFSTGGIATFVMGMGLRDAALTILFFNLLTCIPPAYIVTLAPKTGMRQMILTRYSFGYWGASIPVLFNLMCTFGYGITNSIVGGQVLAAAASPQFPWEVGVTVVNLVALVVTFFGLRVVSWLERVNWIPATVAYIALIALNATKIANQQVRKPATSMQVLNFGAIVAGFQMTWFAIAPDLCVYHRPDASKWKLALSVYLGMVLPVTGLMILGAAVGSSNNPAWTQGRNSGQLYGLMAAIMEPYGAGGKFLNFLFSMSMIGNLCMSIYAKSLNLQLLLPFLTRVPRPLMAVLVVVITIPIAAARARSLYTDLSNFLGIVGVWISAYVPVILGEHFIFRKNSYKNYNVAVWDKASALPLGAAAVITYASAWGVAIPALRKTWYIGPIGATAGDIGFELAFATSTILYPILRYIEIKLFGRRG